MVALKVKFTNISLSQEVDWMHGFLFKNQWGWGKYIIRKHPKIKEIFFLKTENEQVNFLKNYITEFKKENYNIIEKNKIRYQLEWQKIEKDFFNILSEIIQVNWPDNRKTIKGMISINPICPCFLNDWSFSIFYNYKKIFYAMEVIMHESCHFLYFEKWKNIYPEVSNKKFESPHLEWHLSEIIAPIILNDQRVRKLLKQKAVFYDEHEKIKIDNKTLPKYFTELYNQNKCFDEFLDKSYKTIKENKNLFPMN